MAVDPKKLAGVAYLSVDGKSYLLRGQLKYMVSRFERKTLVGQDAVHGYSEMPVAGFISGTFSDSADLSVAAINAMTNVTVTAELANGKTIVARNAWAVDTQEVDTAEGSFDVKWESVSVVEA